MGEKLKMADKHTRAIQFLRLCDLIRFYKDSFYIPYFTCASNLIYYLPIPCCMWLCFALFACCFIPHSAQYCGFDNGSIAANEIATNGAALLLLFLLLLSPGLHAITCSRHQLLLLVYQQYCFWHYLLASVVIVVVLRLFCHNHRVRVCITNDMNINYFQELQEHRLLPLAKPNNSHQTFKPSSSKHAVRLPLNALRRTSIGGVLNFFRYLFLFSLIQFAMLFILFI